MKQWLIGFFASALLSAVALVIVPGNKKPVALAGGLIMLLAAVKPLTQVTYQDIAAQMAKYHIKADSLRTGISVGSNEIISLIIQEQTEAYILDKAQQMGLEVQVTVTTATASDGWPYPDAVTITGQLTEGDKQRLGQIISSQLAIEPDRQEWS